MIKAVVFDLDNTLYDYDACNKKAEEQLFDEISETFGIRVSDAMGLLKQAKQNIKNQLGDCVAASHNRLLYMQNICEQAGKNPLLYAMKFYDVYWNAMLENMRLYDYAEPLFQELRDRDIKIGILTDLTAHIQYRKIARLGLTERVDYLVTSEEAGAEKPSEKMFALMLGKMGVRPEEALMIGDSMTKDIDGARRAGMKAFCLEKPEKDISYILEVMQSWNNIGKDVLHGSKIIK